MSIMEGCCATLCNNILQNSIYTFCLQHLIPGTFSGNDALQLQEATVCWVASMFSSCLTSIDMSDSVIRCFAMGCDLKL